MNRYLALIVGYLLVVALAALNFWHPISRNLDHELLDWQQSELRARIPRDQADHIAIVGISDATVEAIKEPMVLWHEPFGTLLQALAAGGAKVTAFDIIFPDRSYEFLLKGQDRKLLAGLLAAKKAGMAVVLGQRVDQAGHIQPIFPPLLAIAGKDSTGLVLLEKDPDLKIRRFNSHLNAQNSQPLATLAGQIAHRMNKAPLSGYIDYTLGPSFSYIPFETVIAAMNRDDQAWLREQFADAIVLVGGVFPFDDRHAAPVNLATWERKLENQPGVLIQAQIVRNLLRQQGLQRVADWQVGLLMLLATAYWWLGAMRNAGTLIIASGFLSLLTYSSWLVYQGSYLPTASILLTALLAYLLRLMVEATFDYYEKNQLKSSFSRYVSGPVMEEILTGNIRPGLWGEDREVCVFFSDIRGFTQRSETQTARETITLLNRYLDEMTQAIHHHGGTLDKFIGDGIMAFFGAPNQLHNPCQCAMDCAQEMLVRLDALNVQLENEDIPPIRIGVGLNFGQVIIGNVGSVNRYDYTAIGDVVNVASRLESLTKDVGYPVVIAETVHQRLDSATGFTNLGARAVKGHTPIEVYGWRPTPVPG